MTIRIHAAPAAGMPAVFEPWRPIPVAVVADYVRGAQVDPAIRPLNPPGRQPALFGRAVTVRVEPPDFGAAVAALDHVRPGDVFVIAADGNRDFAVLGDVLGGHLRRLGAAGVVVDGAVRDVGQLAQWADLPVFARHVTPRGPIGAAKGDVNAPVAIGGRLVRAGDLVVGDDDGLAVLTEEQARDHLAAAEAKLAREVAWVEALVSGRSAAETFGLDGIERV